jgi:hypothetical protein
MLLKFMTSIPSHFLNLTGMGRTSVRPLFSLPQFGREESSPYAHNDS